MQSHNYAILLAGGQGSRFWPLSRTLEPKQFLSLYKDKALFEETIVRIQPLFAPENIFIVTSELYRYQILELTSVFKIPTSNIIFETESRNTAPSVGVAVRLISLRDPAALVSVLPCDHMIKNKKGFLRLLKIALTNCRQNLVILGIPPTRPATGYGYIKVTRSQSHKVTSKGFYVVEKFLEKPNKSAAERFYKDKRYFWNAGIFIGSGRKFLTDYKTRLPSFYQQLTRIKGPANIQWEKMPEISFDYAIMEKAKDVMMLEAKNLGWSDLGSWQAWDEVLKKDKAGNVLKGDVINLGSKNLTVLAKNHLIATIGLKDLIVIDTPDALLISRKDRSEEVKKVVEALKKNRRQEHYLHRTVKRPWGNYTVLDTGKGFKIKLVVVTPKKSLSLQLHRKRSEHWVVVEGQAKITKGKKSFYLNCNESTFIPLSSVHRLSNPADSLLRIVEVQVGNYLEEDDIVRLADNFGRES